MPIARIGQIVLVVAAVVRSVGGLLVWCFQVPHQSGSWGTTVATAGPCRSYTGRALTVAVATLRIEQARLATAEILNNGAYVGPQALPLDGGDVEVFRRFRFEMLPGLLDLLG